MSLPELLVAVVGGVLVGTVALLAVDGTLALLGYGEFGRTTGWIAGVLPVWLLVEEFRAWRGVRGRYGLLLVVLVVAFLAGLGVDALTASLPALWRGTLGVTAAVVAYAVPWFLGVRWLARAAGEDAG